MRVEFWLFACGGRPELRPNIGSPYFGRVTIQPLLSPPPPCSLFNGTSGSRTSHVSFKASQLRRGRGTRRKSRLAPSAEEKRECLRRLTLTACRARRIVLPQAGSREVTLRINGRKSPLVRSVYRLPGWRFKAEACLASYPLGGRCFQAQVSLQLARDGLEASAH